MRIFYASADTPNPGVDSQLWRSNLFDALVDLGHEVIEFDYDLRETFRRLDPAKPENAAFIATNRPRVSAELERQLEQAQREGPIDLFFSYFYDACVLPETLDRIREAGIPTVNWYCNGSYQMHLVEEISPRYDWCLVPEKFRLDDYRALGARPLYCQEAANPEVYRPYAVEPDLELSFIGQGYGDRPDYILTLIDAGIDARVFGPGWERAARRWRRPWTRLSRRVRGKRDPGSFWGGVLSDEDMIRTYSRTRVNLGLSTCGTTHRSDDRVKQIRLRDFEIPMSGGFYMVEYMDELEEFYDVGQEIVCYEGKHDLVDKARYYLGHDDERDAIREAGRRRCLRDHTWQKRFADAFRAMGLS